MPLQILSILTTNVYFQVCLTDLASNAGVDALVSQHGDSACFTKCDVTSDESFKGEQHILCAAVRRWAFAQVVLIVSR